MQSCSVHHCVLFLLTLTFTTVPTLASNSVTVKLYQPAILPCERNCSGVGKWVLSDKEDIILAQCNQTSCWSEEGYKLFHDQYMVGSLSLTITAVNYSQKNWYTCKCNNKAVNQLRLIIETLTSSSELNPSEDLVMDLPIADPVEVVYKPKKSSHLYGEQICTVTERTLQCKAEYTNRASLSSTNITLRDVQLSDSGIYTIRDTKNNEAIHIYTLYVKEVKMIPEGQQQSHLLTWLIPVLILIFILILIFGLFLMKRCTKRKERLKQQELQLKPPNSLECTMSLLDWLKENMIFHGKETAYKLQRRAYSDTDLGRIMHKEQLEKLIEQYRAREFHLQGRKLDTTFRSESEGYKLPQRSYSDSHQAYSKLKPVSLSEYAAKTARPVNSQQGACSDADVGEVTTQIKELSPLLSNRTKPKR